MLYFLDLNMPGFLFIFTFLVSGCIHLTSNSKGMFPAPGQVWAVNRGVALELENKIMGEV